MSLHYKETHTTSLGSASGVGVWKQKLKRLDEQRWAALSSTLESYTLVRMRKHQPVAGVRLQVLDDVFGDGTDGNGLSLSKVNQVGSDLRAMITRGVPANTQAGRRGIEWEWLRFALLVFLVFLCVHFRLVRLPLWLLQGVYVADTCRHGARRLAQHRLAEGSHASHIHGLNNSKAQESENQGNSLVTRGLM